MSTLNLPLLGHAVTVEEPAAALTKASVGLGNVDNTSDVSKPVSTAQQTALDAKQDTLVSGTNIKTLNGASLLGSGNVTLSASPGGSDTQVQFNDGGAFGGSANFTYNKTTNALTIASSISLSGWYGLVPGANGGISLANGSGNRITWGSTTADPTGANTDTALSRNAAGVLEVNNGTAGTFRDFKARNLTITGGGNSIIGSGNITLVGQVTLGNGFGVFSSGNAQQAQVGRASASHTGGVALMTGVDALAEILISTGTYGDLKLRTLKPQVFTVATLPSASTAGAGARSHVSDASAPTFGATVAGGGAVSTPVYSDGTNWKVG